MGGSNSKPANPATAAAAAAPAPAPAAKAAGGGDGSGKPAWRLQANDEICLLLTHALPGLVEGDPEKPRHATEGSVERALRSALGGDGADDRHYTAFVNVCERESKLLNPSALNNLAWAKLYALGDAHNPNPQKDEVAAVGLFDAAVQRGSSVAENNLLICQIRGVGTGDGAGGINVNGTDVVSASLFRQVRNRCCTVGFFGGGGQAITPQFVFAGLVVLAEQKQCAGAQYNVGCAYYLGVGTKPDVSRAVHYFQRSANAGFLPAMYALAKCLTDGKGVAADPMQAQALIRKASEETLPPAKPSPQSTIAALVASADDAERERRNSKPAELDAKHDSAAAGGAPASPPAAGPSSPAAAEAKSPVLGLRETEWIKEATEMTALTWKLATTNDQWIREGGDVAEGVEVFARQFTSTLKDYAPASPPHFWTAYQKTYKIYRCHALVGGTVQQVFDLLRDENVPAWNPAVDGNKVLQTLDAQTDITYTLASPSVGGAVSSRDFVNVRRAERRVVLGAADEAMNTTNSGTVHEAALPNVYVAGALPPAPAGGVQATAGTASAFIRGFNGPGAYVVLPVMGWDAAKEGFPCCHVIWIMNADLKGWLPVWLVESTLCNVMNRWVKTLRGAIEQRYKTKLLQSPENLVSPSGQLEKIHFKQN